MNRWLVRYGAYRVGRGATRRSLLRNRVPPTPTFGAAPWLIGGGATLIWSPLVWLLWGTIGLVLPIVAILFSWLLIINGYAARKEDT